MREKERENEEESLYIKIQSSLIPHSKTQLSIILILTYEGVLINKLMLALNN